jgi:hypothetical protein
MTTLTVFKSHAPVMGYAFKDGTVIHFRNHMYTTTSPKEIAELTAECEAGHPNYYIDPEQKTIDSEQMDPLAVLTAKIREEERAKLLAATDPTRDMGATAQGKLEGIANSASIQGLQVQSGDQAKAVTTPIKIASPSK